MKEFHVQKALKVGQASSLSVARISAGKPGIFTGNLIDADRLEACPTLTK